MPQEVTHDELKPSAGVTVFSLVRQSLVSDSSYCPSAPHSVVVETVHSPGHDFISSFMKLNLSFATILVNRTANLVHYAFALPV
jgi:hypothetical protein